MAEEELSSGWAQLAVALLEREVARLMAAGKGNAVIARELFLSTKTVRNHVSNILRKLQVADRAQAINLFRDSSG